MWFYSFSFDFRFRFFFIDFSFEKVDWIISELCYEIGVNSLINEPVRWQTKRRVKVCDCDVIRSPGFAFASFFPLHFILQVRRVEMIKQKKNQRRLTTYWSAPEWAMQLCKWVGWLGPERSSGCSRSGYWYWKLVVVGSLCSNLWPRDQHIDAVPFISGNVAMATDQYRLPYPSIAG